MVMRPRMFQRMLNGSGLKAQQFLCKSPKPGRTEATVGMIHKDMSFMLTLSVKSTGEVATHARGWKMTWGIKTVKYCPPCCGRLQLIKNPSLIENDNDGRQSNQWLFSALLFFYSDCSNIFQLRRKKTHSRMASPSAVSLYSLVFKWIERINLWVTTD